MISLRHHLITIVAVFLALAAGIVLGGGPLSAVTDPTAPTSAPAATDESANAQATYGENFAAAVGPSLVAGRLEERQVAIVTVAGSDEQVVSALTDQISAAGGSVAGRYTLAEAMLDPSQKSLVDTLSSQLMTQQPDSVTADASTYDRMGQLMGLAIATKTPEGDPVNGKARAVTDAVTGAELMASSGEVAQKAPLVLFVLGPDAKDDGQDAILAGLLTGLSRMAAGVVVAGATADGGEGQLGRFRADPAATTVATVDGSDTAAGRTSTVLALSRSLGTPGGAFGASGADGPVPLG